MDFIQKTRLEFNLKGGNHEPYEKAAKGEARGGLCEGEKM